MTSISGTSNNPGARGSEFATAKASANDALNRGKEGVTNAASDLASDALFDLESLRQDLNSLKDTVSRFMSQASDVSSSVASQVGSAASSLAESGANMASATKEQAKTLTYELEAMGRRNPLSAMAAAVMVGVLIGLLSRGRGNG